MITKTLKGVRWLLKNADRAKIQQFREYVKNSPKLQGTIAGYGLYELVDYVEQSSDANALNLLNEAAAAVGVDLDAVGEQAISTAVNAGKNLVNKVSNAMPFSGPEFSLDGKVTLADTQRDESLWNLARFLKGEVSTNPNYLKRYHQMMGTFLRMDEVSAQNFLNGVYFK